MWQFIKYVLATIVGIFLFSIIAVFLLIGLGAAISSSSNDKVEVKDNSVLKLNLNQLVVEDAPEDPLGPFGDMFSSGGAYTGVVQVKEALRHAQNDSHSRYSAYLAEILRLSAVFSTISSLLPFGVCNADPRNRWPDLWPKLAPR